MTSDRHPQISKRIPPAIIQTKPDQARQKTARPCKSAEDRQIRLGCVGFHVGLASALRDRDIRAEAGTWGLMLSDVEERLHCITASQHSLKPRLGDRPPALVRVYVDLMGHPENKGFRLQWGIGDYRRERDFNCPLELTVLPSELDTLVAWFSSWLPAGEFPAALPPLAMDREFRDLTQARPYLWSRRAKEAADAWEGPRS